jgi:hypothetical protein
MGKKRKSTAEYLAEIMEQDGYRIYRTKQGRIAGVDSPFDCEELGGINRRLTELDRLRIFEKAVLSALDELRKNRMDPVPDGQRWS